MNGGIAYHLKQIMTNEHLNLTQTAKLIGISVTSLRKVLKDTPLSQPIMFKINRFIDEHRQSAATPDIHSVTKPAFTITQTSEHQPGQQPVEVIEPGNRAQQSQSNKQTAKKQTRSRRTEKGEKATPAKPQSAKKQATAAKAEPKKQAKQTTKADANNRRQQAKKADAKAHQEAPAKAADNAKRGRNGKNQNQPRNRRNPASTSQAQRRNGSQAASTSVSQSLSQSASQRRGRGRRSQSTRSAAAGSQSQSVPTSTQASLSTAKATRASQNSAIAELTAALAPTSQSQAAPARAKAVETTLQLFIDESFKHGNSYNRSMYIGITALDPDDSHALDKFSQTLYPFGWQPGDEVKARGKDQQQVATLLRDATDDATQNFVVYSPLSDAGNFSMGFGVLYPYLAAILRVLDTYATTPDKVRIALDKRNEIEGEQLGIAARILNSYLKSATGKNVIFMLRTADSKEELGLQFSDFVAHSALAFDQAQLADFGIRRLEDVGSALGDELTMYSMIGLQKYLLDDHAEFGGSKRYKSALLQAADRLFRLSSKAVTLADVPAETLAQAKLVLNQLLQIAPSSVSGGINNMPFQNWYDMVARAAAFLHYTDESLPNFTSDPDAMQIANDALNNIANLLASAK